MLLLRLCRSVMSKVHNRPHLRIQVSGKSSPKGFGKSNKSRSAQSTSPSIARFGPSKYVFVKNPASTNQCWCNAQSTSPLILLESLRPVGFCRNCTISLTIDSSSHRNVLETSWFVFFKELNQPTHQQRRTTFFNFNDLT